MDSVVDGVGVVVVVAAAGVVVVVAAVVVVDVEVDDADGVDGVEVGADDDAVVVGVAVGAVVGLVVDDDVDDVVGRGCDLSARASVCAGVQYHSC